MTTNTAGKKITIATVRNFIRRNRATLLIRENSRFDGMLDCVRDNDASDYAPAVPRQWYCQDTGKFINCREDNKTTLGLSIVWFTGGDYCQQIETNNVYGYEVSNCCGRWQVVITK